MSDTPTQDQGTPDDGRLHAEDLAKAIQVAPSLDALRGGTAVGFHDGANIILHRLPGQDAMAANADIPLAIAHTIYLAIPEELRNEKVLQSIDLRPYLEYMKTNSDKALHVYRNSNILGGDLFGADDWQATGPAVFDHFITGITKDATERAVKKQQGNALTDEERQRVTEAITQYNPSVAGLAPTQEVLDTGAVTAVTTGSADVSTLDFTSGEGAPTVSASSVFDLYRPDLLDPGTYDQALGALQDAEQQGGTDLPVVIQRGGETGSMRPGAGKKMSVWEARNSIYSMKPKELAQLTKNLTDAGVFDRLGAAPDDPNDAFDPVLNKAWDYVLAQSIGRNTPVNDWLKGEAGTYRAKKAEMVRTQNAALTQEDYGNTLNSVAMNTIGRQLDGYEQRMVLGYLKRLNADRNSKVAGDKGYQAPTQTEGQLQNDVQNVLQDQFATEAQTAGQPETTNGTGPLSVLHRIGGDS